MRHSNHADRGRRLPRMAVGLFAVIVAGCGSSAAASLAPSVAPTPVVTPDPHLSEPVTADQIYTILAKANLQVTSTNANLGHGNPLVIKQINASLRSWPLRITQYRSAADMTKALRWPDGPPGGNEAPYSFAALNILIQFGPISAKAPVAPDPARQQDAAAIVAVLDPLLWPLTQRSVAAIPSRTAAPTARPATPAPSTKPARTPKPSKAP